ncbi:replication fork protection component Swi3-domain-containing protein [Piptocephalis cylindrospora]|uniref:Chromosome segregation in meiosis protein n=1 Tax=Piptocephalis cylindrospora TaxID=1907219 RepID=A0A4P9Y936_9FUNG|nr:replication fork protection component Swi3-domain-containing protein [Piptocephalis cylindrospora]|eukprot:RKP14510.1 replication fork protection component Swi3-domain-containing protein [Piptocephalis cylindrospora]
MTREVTYEPLEDYDLPRVHDKDAASSIQQDPGLDLEEAPKTRAPRAKLDEPRLLDHDHGLPALLRDARHLHFGGKRTTVHQDLDKLLKYYGLWAHQLFPRLAFTDCIRKVESVCHKKRLKMYLREWRNEWSYQQRDSVSADNLAQIGGGEDVFFDSDDENVLTHALERQDEDSVAENLPNMDAPDHEFSGSFLSSLLSSANTAGILETEEDKEEDWPEEFSRLTQKSNLPTSPSPTSVPTNSAPPSPNSNEAGKGKKEESGGAMDKDEDLKGLETLHVLEKRSEVEEQFFPSSKAPSRKRRRFIIPEEEDGADVGAKKRDHAVLSPKRPQGAPSRRSLAFISEDEDEQDSPTKSIPPPPRSPLPKEIESPSTPRIV